MPDYENLILAAKSRNWKPTIEFINMNSNEAAIEALKFISNQLDTVKDFDAIIGAREASPVIFGALCFFLGGKARGGALPENMSEEQTEYYLSALIAGNEVIEVENAKNPKNGLIGSFLMGYAIDEISEGQKQDAEFKLRDCENVPISGYLNLVSAFCEKWGGSHDEMFYFARKYFNKSNPATGALIAKAHFERRLYISHFEEDPDNERRYEEYYNSPAKEELMSASELLLNSSSLDEAEFRLAHGWFALTLGMSGFYKQARKHLLKLNGFHDSGFWSILPVARVFKLYWKIAGIFSKE